MAYLAEARPAECAGAGTGRHPGSETYMGLPGEQNLHVRRGHMRSWPHYDELPTFRGETEHRQHGEMGGSSCALAERRRRHDMTMMMSSEDRDNQSSAEEIERSNESFARVA